MAPNDNHIRVEPPQGQVDARHYISIRPRRALRANRGWIFWHFLAMILFQLVVMRRASAVLSEQYGQFAHLYAITSFALAFTLIGLHTTLMRHLAICADRDAFHPVLGILVRCMIIRFILLFMTATGLWLYLHHRTAPPDLEVIMYVCLLVLMQGMVFLQHAALQGLGRYGWLAIASTCLLLGLFCPMRDLAGVFRVLVTGYGCSFVLNTVALGWTLRRSGVQQTPPVLDGTDVFQILRFSLLLSIGALFTIAADSAPIILLKGAYSDIEYSCLALSFHLCLYPARFNSLSEALTVPQLSAAIHGDAPSETRRLVDGWLRILQIAALVIILPVILLTKPFIELFFPVEMRLAATYTALIMLVNLPRLILPVPAAVLIGIGRPGLVATCSGVKFALDLMTIVLCRGIEPVFLVAGLIVNWIVYVELIYLLMRKQLGLRCGLLWWTLLIPALGWGILILQLDWYVLAPGWVAAATYGVVRRRQLWAGVT